MPIGTFKCGLEIPVFSPMPRKRQERLPVHGLGRNDPLSQFRPNRIHATETEETRLRATRLQGPWN